MSKVENDTMIHCTFPISTEILANFGPWNASFLVVSYLKMKNKL